MRKILIFVIISAAGAGCYTGLGDAQVAESYILKGVAIMSELNETTTTPEEKIYKDLSTLGWVSGDELKEAVSNYPVLEFSQYGEHIRQKKALWRVRQLLSKQIDEQERAALVKGKKAMFRVRQSGATYKLEAKWLDGAPPSPPSHYTSRR